MHAVRRYEAILRRGDPYQLAKKGYRIFAIILFCWMPLSASSGDGRSISGPFLPDENVPQVIRGPYLQMGTGESMTIKWRTDVSTDSKVWYGPGPANLNQSITASGTRTNHEVMITGLEANSKYYYAIGHTGGVLAGGTPEHYFNTAPHAGTVQPVKAWVLGDCGTANDNARAVRDGYYTYAGNSNPDLILLLGDNAYDDGKDSEYQVAMFENMYEAALIHSVVWPVPGNHEFGASDSPTQTGPYFDIFTLPRNGEAGGLPSGTEAYYSFDYANIHFVCLDSHDSGKMPGDPMLIWLENDLHATLQEWIVVLFHHPPYSKGSHDSDDVMSLTMMRENVLPILENAGVDLVLSGHSHSYERSYLMHGHYGYSSTLLPSMIVDDGDGRAGGAGPYNKELLGPNADKGAVYVVAGSSGKVSDGPLNHPVMYYNALTLGSLSLEVAGQQLDVKFLGTTGDVMDYFTIRKYTPVGNPPAVSITSPANGTVFPTVQPVDIEAHAFDTDGTVENVVFFVNGDSVGIDYTAPYALSWTPPAEGIYNIKARAMDNDGNPFHSPVFEIQFGGLSICSKISHNDDDAEERGSGEVDLRNSDLELVNETNDVPQTVGLRFRNLGIPPGSTITGAYIQFTADETRNDNPCNLTITGDASDDAAPFSSAANNISSRLRTTASVGWSPPNWLAVGDAGPAQQTPDISIILQEIVNRPGYAAGSSIAFIIEGAGARTAETRDGASAKAAEICVEYYPSPPAYDCPLYSANIGAPCYDGDYSTLNDTLDINCNCVGTPTPCIGIGDADGDGVCADMDCNDFDPGITSRIGSACDDGNDATVNDAIDSNCNCTGILTTCTGMGDNDGDGICAHMDCDDNDPGITSQMGDACDDGDNTTINDRLNAHCDCKGLPTACTGIGDNDGDGVCADADCDDNDPGITAQIGDSCNDGDNTTFNDIIDANCNCHGMSTPCTGTGDNDGDGICAYVDCDDSDPSITSRPGEACDDGDNTTANDQIGTDCICAGTPIACTGIGDNDGDGVCADADCDDNNASITSQPGEACDDGDNTTVNDQLNADCNCTGTPTACTGIGDNDGDGICADVDCNDNDPSITSQPGEACDDGDNTTVNDQLNADCNCTGTPTACTGIGDNDGDGICANADCDDNDASITLQPGDTCDDDNPATFGETIQADCSCGGGISPVTICSAIDDKYDDAEENSSGTMDLNSSDLELADEPRFGQQTVGLRFNGLNIPQGAIVTSAFLQFTADEIRNINPCTLAIYGQASDDAATFAAANYNISSRPRTSATVSWAPQDWLIPGEAETAQLTPDLSAIIQEVVNRSDFTAGSSIALIIDGFGNRTAKSFNNSPANAPELCVEYYIGPPPPDCPALAANIGDACNDGDNTTINDMVGADCNCAGTPTACTGIGDNDGDGFCADVDCNDNDASITSQPGDVCDDGDNTTLDDTIGANCNCAGTPTACTGIGDNDGDDICADVDCNDNDDSITSQPGDVCDDGDNTTINDMIDANCNCAGTPTACTGIGDNDGDDICADVDCNDNDDSITSQPGDVCDDGDNTTINDMIDANCNCAGTPTACTGIGDNDGDDICTDVDCNDNDDSITSQPGDACDDGNPNTIGEFLQPDCRCAGGILLVDACYSILSKNDDAEELLSGKVNRTSSDLELINDPIEGNQKVGLRFADLDIPQGSVINSAYIQFTNDLGQNVNPCNLIIYGQDSDIAESFVTVLFNITSRPRTSAQVAWTPADWAVPGSAGADQRTPDIAPIIQEIVNRPGFQQNGSIVIMIEGTGRRTAGSFDLSPDSAPELCLQFTPAAPATKPAPTTGADENRIDTGLVSGSEALLSGAEAISPLHIHPNPAKDRITVSFTSVAKGQGTIQIRGLNGGAVLKEARKIQVGENKLNVEGLSLPGGMYFLQLYVGSTVRSSKFVIMKQ